jgi:hypothetical protein
MHASGYPSVEKFRDDWNEVDRVKVSRTLLWDSHFFGWR